MIMNGRNLFMYRLNKVKDFAIASAIVFTSVASMISMMLIF